MFHGKKICKFVATVQFNYSYHAFSFKFANAFQTRLQTVITLSSAHSLVKWKIHHPRLSNAPTSKYARFQFSIQLNESTLAHVSQWAMFASQIKESKTASTWLNSNQRWRDESLLVKQLNVSGGGKTVQRTVVEKSYSAGSGGYSGGSGAYGRSYVNGKLLTPKVISKKILKIVFSNLHPIENIFISSRDFGIKPLLRSVRNLASFLSRNFCR